MLEKFVGVRAGGTEVGPENCRGGLLENGLSDEIVTSLRKVLHANERHRFGNMVDVREGVHY